MFEFCTSDNIHSAFCFFWCLKKPKTQTQPNWKWNKTNKPKTKKKPTRSKSRKGFSLTGNINSAHPWSLCIARCCHMCVIKHIWLIVVWCDWHMRFYLAVYTIWPDYCFTDPFKNQSRNVMLFTSRVLLVLCSSAGHSWVLELRDKSTAGFMVCSSRLFPKSLPEIQLHYYWFPPLPKFSRF